ncbi:MAG: hypothetical protein ACT4O3_07405 [Elusimicrobiota bacterium]
MAAVAFPFLAGYAGQTSELAFTGAVHDPDDFHSYLAWARQARDGFFFMADKYTTEAQPRAIALPYFWIVGAASRVSSLPLHVCMNLAQAAGLVFFLWSLLRWLGNILPSSRQRDAAFGLALFSSGFGAPLAWLMDRWPGGPDAPRFVQAPGLAGAADLLEFDLITFPNLAYYPFSGWTLGLLLLCFRWFGRLRSGSVEKPAAAAGLAAALLFLIHPYDGLIAWGAAWTLPLLQPLPWPDRRKALGLFYGLSAPALLYAAAAVKINPVLAVYAEAVRSYEGASLLSNLIGLGPLLPPAAAGAFLAFRRGAANALFPAVWAGAALAASTLPLGFQDKLLHGAHIALCALAARGIAGLWASRTNHPRPCKKAAAAACGLLLAAGAATNLRIWTEHAQAALAPGAPLFLPRPLEDALEHLDRDSGPQEAVLAHPVLGLYVPPRTGSFTYIGHWDQTLHHEAKRRVAQFFYSPRASGAARCALLKKEGIAHVLLHPAAVRAGGWDDSSCLEKTFGNEHYRVYRVRR